MTTMQAHIAQERLGLLEDVLLASGWQKSADGYLPPATYGEAIAISHGRGAWRLHHAVMFMAAMDAHLTAGDRP